MKQLIIWVLAVTCVVGASGAIYLLNEGHSSEGVIMKDVTDLLSEKISSNDILELVDLPGDPWGAATLTFLPINDIRQNKKVVVSLPAEIVVFSNPEKREKSIRQFNSQVMSATAVLNAIPEGRENSEIIIPLIRSLNQLSHAKAYNRFLVYYGNLHENSQLFSTYNDQHLTKIKSSPDSLLRLIATQEMLEELNGITVYLVFQPSNGEEEKRFEAMSQFLKRLINDAGGRVVTGANLIKRRS